MNTKELDPGQASYDLYLPGQRTPMVVTSDAETIQAEYEALQATQRAAKVARVSRTIEQTARPVHGVVGVLQRYAGTVATNYRAILYDKMNGTQFYPALLEQRQLERDRRMAARLGLMTIEPCQKHRKEIDEVRQFR